MERDQNLLFGVLAVQLRKITPTQLVDVAGAWAMDPSRDLPERLVETGVLSERDCKLVTGLVDAAVKANDGDVAATLDSFGGEGQVYQSFRGSVVMTDSGGVQAASAHPPMELSDGAPVAGVQESPGRYTQLGEYGRGGMARVLLVYDDYLAREVALKELFPSAASGDASAQLSPARLAMPIIARFLQEARITGQLEHPAIVPVYELGYRKDGTLYYTMKLVRGKTLAQAIKETHTLRERLELLPHFVDLCHAIAYAHSRHVIHRDIKPYNVMVGEFGETVVLDWGLAKSTDKYDVHADGLAETIVALRTGDPAQIQKTLYGHALGTPSYMPPEQAKGQLDAVGERSDVYSLGAVLYEILTGKPPYEGTSAQDIIRKVLSEAPVPPAQAAPDAPPELAAICARALRKESVERYQSARELAEDIERFQSGSLVQAYEYGIAEHLRRWASRYKPILATAAAALIIALSACVYSYVSILQARNRERDQRILAEQARDHAEQAKQEAVTAREQEAKARKIAELASYTAALGRAEKCIEKNQLAEAREDLWDTPEDLRNWEWAFLLRKAHPYEELFVLKGHTGRVTCGEFSPDGKRIATGSEDKTVKIYDAQTAQEVLTLTGPTEGVSKVMFSPPDGARLLSVSKDYTVRVWDSETGHALFEAGGPELLIGDACWCFSRGSAHIATDSAISGIQLWDVQTGILWATLEGGMDVTGAVESSKDGHRVLARSARVVKVWDADSGALLTIITPKGSPRSAVFALDGAGVVTRVFQARESGADSDRAILWDAETGRPLHEFDEGYKSLSVCDVSPDGKYLLTSGDGDREDGNGPFGGTAIWDLAVGKKVSSTQGSVPLASFVPGTDRVVFYDWYGSELRDAADLHIPGQPIGLLLFNSLVWFSPDGTRGMTVSYAGVDTPPRVFQVPSRDAERRRIPWAKSYGRGDFGAESSRLITISHHACAVWDAETLSELAAFDLALAASPSSGSSEFWADANRDGTRVVISYPVSPNQSEAAVWEVATGRLLVRFSRDKGPIVRVAWNPVDERVVVAGKKGSLKVWDAEAGTEVASLMGHEDDVVSVNFSKDGAHLVTASADGTARVWDTETWKVSQILGGHKGRVYFAAFDTDGGRVVTCGSDQSVRIWDTETGKELLLLLERDDFYKALFTPDGARVATSGRQVSVWDSRTGVRLSSLPPYDEPLNAFDSYGDRVLYGMELVRVPPWRVDRLPGDPSMNAPDRYELWCRQERERKRPEFRRSGPIPHTVLISRTNLDNGIEVLSDLVGSQNQDSKAAAQAATSGLAVETDALESILSPWGFLWGDVILRAHNLETKTLSDFVTAMRGYIKAREQDHELSLCIAVRRDGEPRAMTLLVRDFEEIEFQVSVPRAVAEIALPFVIQTMENTDRAVFSGLGKSSVGLFFDDIPPSFEPFLAQVGVENGDRIIAVNGITLDSADAALSILKTLKTLLDAVKDGQGANLRYDVERGSFRVKVTVSLE